MQRKFAYTFNTTDTYIIVLLISIAFHFHCLARHENAYFSFVDFNITGIRKRPQIHREGTEIQSKLSVAYYSFTAHKSGRASLPNVVILWVKLGILLGEEYTWSYLAALIFALFFFLRR